MNILQKIKILEEQKLSICKELDELDRYKNLPPDGEFYLLMASCHKNIKKAIKTGGYYRTLCDTKLTDHNFPIKPMGLRVIQLIQFKNHTTPARAIKLAEKQGLACPDYMDAFDFGEQHPDIQFKNPIIFLYLGLNMLTLSEWNNKFRILTQRNAERKNKK